MSAAEAELLQKDHPSQIVGIVSVFSVALIATVVFVTGFVPLPERLECPFLLAPETGTDPVKAPISGAIEKVTVVDGTEVKAGDALFTIRSENLGVLAERAKRLEREIDASRPVEAAQIAMREAQMRAMRARIKSLGAELTHMNERKAVVSRLLEMAQSGREKGLISELDLLNARQADADAGRELERLRRDQETARADHADIEAAAKREAAERARASARRQGDLAEAKAAVSGSRQTEVEAEQSLFAVVAPYDGIISDMGPRRAGAVIERGEILCRIANRGSRLRAELSVPELDAGKIARGQPVQLLLDAFPYTRFGTRTASVAWISPTAEEKKIRAFAVPFEQQGFVVDGLVRPLRPGMSGKAHVVTGARTLAQYGLDLIRRLAEYVQGAEPRASGARSERSERTRVRGLGPSGPRA